jgi:tungstate transport system permease protein
MNSMIEGFLKAFSLIYNLDQELLGIILLSLKVSGTALIVSSVIGVPAGAVIGLKNFPGEAS